MDRPRQRRRIWVKRLVPWVITAAVLIVLLRQYSLAQVLEEMSRGTVWPLIPCSLSAALAALLMVGVWDGILFRAALGPVRYIEVVAGKAATSLLLVIAYGAGHGAYGVWAARKTGADIRTTIGVMIYISLADMAALSLLTSIVFLATDYPLPHNMREIVSFGAPVIAAVLIAVALAGPRWLVSWVREPRLLKPWAAVPPHIYMASVLGRMLGLGLLMAAAGVAMHGFGLHVPAPVVMSYMPLILLVSALPINVAGFGAVQAAWLLFARWAPGEQILAFQFLWHLAVTAALVVRGAPFLPRLMAELGRGRPRVPADGVAGGDIDTGLPDSDTTESVNTDPATTDPEATESLGAGAR